MAFAVGGMMRLLIGFYLTHGTLQALLAGAVGLFGLRHLLMETSSGPRRGGPGAEEAFAIALLGFVLAAIPLLAAYGLWRRWRLMRLVLLGACWWSFAIVIAVCGITLAHAAALVDAAAVLSGEPLWQTLATAAAITVFAGWQYWALTRPAVRQSFEKLG
jgi:hypothetical protein